MHDTIRPTVDDLDALGTALTLVAPPDYEDENGHVNVGHYYRLHMQGGDAAFAAYGFDDDYRERTGHSVFSAEHHITFLDESLVGDELSVHLRVLGVGSKALHAQTILVNRSRGTVANTVESLELHVDLTTRRTTPMPPDLVARLEAVCAEHSALPWSLPLAGPLGVR